MSWLCFLIYKTELVLLTSVAVAIIDEYVRELRDEISVLLRFIMAITAQPRRG